MRISTNFFIFMKSLSCPANYTRAMTVTRKRHVTVLNCILFTVLAYTRVLSNSSQKTSLLTYSLFDRIISLMTPNDSWVARWQRIGMDALFVIVLEFYIKTYPISFPGSSLFLPWERTLVVASHSAPKIWELGVVGKCFKARDDGFLKSGREGTPGIRSSPLSPHLAA